MSTTHIPTITVIVASTRPTRFADVPLAWIQRRLGARSDLALDVLDLREHPLPFFDHAMSPAANRRNYTTVEETTVGRLLDESDGYLVLTNEYNHGYGAALKNVLDHYFIEFQHKPMAFVGYGNVGGSRAIEQLRLVAAELDMASVRPSVHIFGHQMRALMEGGPASDTVYEAIDPRLDLVVDDLVWWSNALSTARARDEALAS